MTITVPQPAATLIARGQLTVITRRMPAPDAWHGRTIPIRAAAKPPKPSTVGAWSITNGSRGVAMSDVHTGERIGLPCGVIVAEVVVVTSFPIRELAGCFDPPTGHWVAITPEGRLYWQSSDQHHLSTQLWMREAPPAVRWAPGLHVWLLADPRPVTVNPRGAASCNV